jgi:glycolate oxidase
VTVVALFDDVGAAGRAVEQIMATSTPSMLELLDRTTMQAVEEWRPSGLPVEAGALLLAQSDLAGSGADDEAEAILAACLAAGAMEGYRSEDPEQAEMLLGARRMAIQALEAKGDWLLDDVAIPRSALAAAVSEIEEVAARHDVLIGTFGHAGDGNLHPTIVTPRGDADAAARGLAAFDDILSVALRHGGTITGEHGVGLLKRQALAEELDEPARDLHPRIKEAFDPRGILNPGKSLPRW